MFGQSHMRLVYHLAVQDHHAGSWIVQEKLADGLGPPDTIRRRRKCCRNGSELARVDAQLPRKSVPDRCRDLLFEYRLGQGVSIAGTRACPAATSRHRSGCGEKSCECTVLGTRSNPEVDTQILGAKQKRPQP